MSVRLFLLDIACYATVLSMLYAVRKTGTCLTIRRERA
jgi:hypothetical protein